jgi:hypothetical protein
MGHLGRPLDPPFHCSPETHMLPHVTVGVFPINCPGMSPGSLFESFPTNTNGGQ